MAVIPFDTLKAAERLERAGWHPDQAREFVYVLMDIVVTRRARIAERLATQADLAQEMRGLRGEADALIDTVERSVADLKTDVIRAIGMTAILQFALTGWLLIFLSNP